MKEVLNFIIQKTTKKIQSKYASFTVHPEPSEDFSQSDRIHKIVIPNNFRKELKITLNRYGINRSSLFLDLDGLSRYIQWSRSTSTEH